MLILLTAVPCGSSILQGAAGIYTKETPASNFFSVFFEEITAYRSSFVTLFSCVFYVITSLLTVYGTVILQTI